MLEFAAVRAGNALLPATDHDETELMKAAEFTPMAARIWRPRHLPMHRFYWGLISYVANGIGMEKEQLHVKLKIKAGLIDRINLKDKSYLVVRSSAFDAMGEDEFRKYVRVVLDIVVFELLPHVNRRELVRRLEIMLGIRFSWEDMVVLVDDRE